jgi:glycosyltransferase involved in cell wall biosynthesis
MFQPPAISPVPDDEARPLWSVMIPTFNCARYLRQTLRSVLGQDPGPEQMEIEVVDDGSTKDDPEAVVREVGGGRVRFHRRPANGGATRNFNTCIERSRGRLIHILHGDDFVLPGFYATLGAAAAAHPAAQLIACRSFFVGEDDVIFHVSQRLPELEGGAATPEPFFYDCPLQTPTVVVRRDFYERRGGFLPELIHAADCEMWSRALAEGGVVLPQVLAAYRKFTGSDTGRLARTAENLRDTARLYSLYAEKFPAFDRQRALDGLCRHANDQALRFAAQGDPEAAEANRAFSRQHASLKLRLRTLARKWLGPLFR